MADGSPDVQGWNVLESFSDNSCTSFTITFSLAKAVLLIIHFL